MIVIWPFINLGNEHAIEKSKEWKIMIVYLKIIAYLYNIE